MNRNTLFKDYFSGHADDYSKYRPKYPAALFSYLASLTQTQQRAWDCATGNGQSAVALAEYFQEVIATDASEKQIENAVSKNGITYRVATAEDSGIDSSSVDLITVAQAFHWFNRQDFATEVDRVLKNDGILAIWTYNLLSINPSIDKILYHLYDGILGNYWHSNVAWWKMAIRMLSCLFWHWKVRNFRWKASGIFLS